MDGRHDARDDADAVHPREYVLPRLVLANSAVIDFALVAHCVTLLNDTVAGLSRRRRRRRGCAPRAWSAYSRRYVPRPFAWYRTYVRKQPEVLRVAHRCLAHWRPVRAAGMVIRQNGPKNLGPRNAEPTRRARLPHPAPPGGARAVLRGSGGPRRRGGRASNLCPVSAATPPQIGPKVGFASSAAHLTPPQASFSAAHAVQAVLPKRDRSRTTCVV